MNGPDHYQEAAKLLQTVNRYCDDTADALALAQVHATLALAAATALHHCGMTDHDRTEWRAATNRDQAKP